MGARARLTPADVEEVARDFYGDHPAAVSLILEGTRGATEERRQRSSRALACLDTADLSDPIELPTAPDRPDPLDHVARAIADAILRCVRSPERRDRLRLAQLLNPLLREAARAADSVEAAG